MSMLRTLMRRSMFSTELLCKFQKPTSVSLEKIWNTSSETVSSAKVNTDALARDFFGILFVSMRKQLEM